MPRLMHGLGADHKDDAGSSPSTDALGSRDVRREMHGMATPWQQALAPDRFDVAHRRPVKQKVRRSRQGEAEIHVDRMALVGSDPRGRSIKSEALLVAGTDDSVKLFARYRAAMLGQSREQHLDVHPAGAIKGDPYARRLVPQDQGQEPGGSPIVHLHSVAPATGGGGLTWRRSATQPGSPGVGARTRRL